jgi:hypothetical protein
VREGRLDVCVAMRRRQVGWPALPPTRRGEPCIRTLVAVGVRRTGLSGQVHNPSRAALPPHRHEEIDAQCVGSACALGTGKAQWDRVGMGQRCQYHST